MLIIKVKVYGHGPINAKKTSNKPPTFLVSNNIPCIDLYIYFLHIMYT